MATRARKFVGCAALRSVSSSAITDVVLDESSISHCVNSFSGVTILLSLTVFLNLVAEKMPTTSDAVPLIGMTLCFSSSGDVYDTWSWG